MKTILTLLVVSIFVSTPSKQTENSVSNNPSPVDSKQFLKEFLQEYAKGQDADMSRFMDEEIEFTTANNPGAACVIDVAIEDEWRMVLDKNGLITKGFPTEGNFCEGYPGASNGIYYAFIDYIDMKSYMDYDVPEGHDEDFYMHHPIKPEKYKDASIAKVQIIQDEFHYVFLYFLVTESEWVYWVEDMCDCSA